mgnify:CR=1 FL=1|jgi:hypothetical protein
MKKATKKELFMRSLLGQRYTLQFYNLPKDTKIYIAEYPPRDRYILDEWHTKKEIWDLYCTYLKKRTLRPDSKIPVHIPKDGEKLYDVVEIVERRKQ